MTPSFCASILKPRRARRLCLCRSRRLSVPLSVALISPSLPHWCNKRQTCLRTTGGAWDSHPTLSGSKQQRVALHTRCNTRTINHICFSLGAYTHKHTHTPRNVCNPTVASASSSPFCGVTMKKLGLFLLMRAR